MSEDVSSLQADYDRLKLLYQVSTVINSTLDPQQAVQLILREAVRVMRASSGSIALINPNNGMLEMHASVGLSPISRHRSMLLYLAANAVISPARRAPPRLGSGSWSEDVSVSYSTFETSSSLVASFAKEYERLVLPFAASAPGGLGYGESSCLWSKSIYSLSSIACAPWRLFFLRYFFCLTGSIMCWPVGDVTASGSLLCTISAKNSFPQA